MWFQLIIENVKIRWKKCVDGIYTAEGLENKTALWSKYHFIVRQEALRLHKRLPA
ncbi:RNA polymerase sigma factor FliA, partial [Escherichia coli]